MKGFETIIIGLSTLFCISVFSSHASAALSCDIDCPSCKRVDGKMVVYGKMTFEVTVTGDAADNPASGYKIVTIKTGEYTKEASIPDGATKGSVKDFDTMEASKNQDGIYKIRCDVYRFDITELGFSGDFKITRYPAGTVIDQTDNEPVWKKLNNPDEPAAYIKNTIPTVFATMTAEYTATAPITVSIRYSSGFLFGNVVIGKLRNVNLNAGINFITGISGGSPIPVSNAVKILTPPFVWEISLDKEKTWQKIATTGPHKLYFVENTPLESPLYDLALEKAATYVNGGSNVGLLLAQGIDNDIVYDPGQPCIDTNPIDIYSAGRCQCIHNARLLQQLSRSVGIDSHVDYIWAGHGSDWDLFIQGSTGRPVSIRVDVPAHDRALDKPHFTFHAQTVIGGSYFDPSYGTSGLANIIEMAPQHESCTQDPSDPNLEICQPGSGPGSFTASRQTGTGLPSSIHGVNWVCPH